MFLSNGDECVWELLEFHQGCQGPPQEGRWNFSRDMQWRRASFRVKGIISWFFSSCARKLGVPLLFQQGPQGQTRVAAGKSSLHASCKWTLGTPLQSVPGPTSSSEAEAGTSRFLSSADSVLGVPMELQQWSQASSWCGDMQAHFPLEL